VAEAVTPDEAIRTLRSRMAFSVASNSAAAFFCASQSL
jgi:hypothetical protein